MVLDTAPKATVRLRPATLAAAFGAALSALDVTSRSVEGYSPPTSVAALLLLLLGIHGLHQARPWGRWLIATLASLVLLQAWGYWRIPGDLQSMLPHYTWWRTLSTAKALALALAAGLAFRPSVSPGAAPLSPTSAEPSPEAHDASLRPRVLAVLGTMLWSLLATALFRGMAGRGVLVPAMTLPPLAVTARFLLAPRLTPFPARLAATVGVLGAVWCALLVLLPAPYAPFGLYLLLSPKGWLGLAAAVGGSYTFWHAGTLVRTRIAGQPAGPA